MFSLLDFLVGDPEVGEASLWMTLSLYPPGESSPGDNAARPALVGEVLPVWPYPVFVGDDGASFIAFSNTFGRSMAPGGCLLLLGLPWGVWGGLVKPYLVGVEGRS